MLLDVILDVMFSYEFVIIITCLIPIIIWVLEDVLFGNRKDEDNAQN